MRIVAPRAVAVASAAIVAGAGLAMAAPAASASTLSGGISVSGDARTFEDILAEIMAEVDSSTVKEELDSPTAFVSPTVKDMLARQQKIQQWTMAVQQQSAKQ